MRVKMKVKLSGTRNGLEWPDPGGEVDLPNEEAAQLLAHKQAERVDVGKVESATVETKPMPRKSAAKD